MENLEDYLDKSIEVQVFDVDKDQKRLILSRKGDTERKSRRAAQKEHFQCTGRLCHRGHGRKPSALRRLCKSWKRPFRSGAYFPDLRKENQKPSEVLAEGDKVKVKVTAVKDGKLSLSIKEATDMMAKEIEEEVIELPDSKEEASTSLGALFANLKLDK